MAIRTTALVLCEAKRRRYLGPNDDLVEYRDEARVFFDSNVAYEVMEKVRRRYPGDWYALSVLVHQRSDGKIIDIEPWEDQEPWDDEDGEDGEEE